MRKAHWTKVYVGPFDKEEAEAIAADLKKIADPDVNAIHDARVRRRGRTGINSERYDVFALTTLGV